MSGLMSTATFRRYHMSSCCLKISAQQVKDCLTIQRYSIHHRRSSDPTWCITLSATFSEFSHLSQCTSIHGCQAGVQDVVWWQQNPFVLWCSSIIVLCTKEWGIFRYGTQNHTILLSSNSIGAKWSRDDYKLHKNILSWPVVTIGANKIDFIRISFNFPWARFAIAGFILHCAMHFDTIIRT